jgi:hypothetical protein
VSGTWVWFVLLMELSSVVPEYCRYGSPVDPLPARKYQVGQQGWVSEAAVSVSGCGTLAAPCTRAGSRLMNADSAAGSARSTQVDFRVVHVQPLGQVEGAFQAAALGLVVHGGGVVGGSVEAGGVDEVEDRVGGAGQEVLGLVL